MEINLSDKQKEIVDYGQGAVLVKASAGSGKTRVLTERIKRHLNTTDRKILAITFTNKAGEEMKERLEMITDINKRLFIGTFHGFCQQVLENHGKAIGFSKVPHIFEEESDRIKLVEQAIETTPSYHSKYTIMTPKEQKDFLYKVLNFISDGKRRLLSEESLIRENPDENTVLLYSAYQDLLRSQNAIDFDDLIHLSYTLFITNPQTAALYRRTYEYICIDEAQDLNYAQYQLLRSLTGDEHRNVMMVGDPNQSIFAFNGSSSEYMMKNFIKDYQPKIFELKENYRSSKKVLESANRIFPKSCDLANCAITGDFEIVKLNDEKLEAKWIANKINSLIEMKKHNEIEGNITYEKIAILGRNKYVFTHLTEYFMKNNIPYYYKITPGAIVFESDLMKIFDLALRVKINPQDTLHWNRLLELCKKSVVNNFNDLIVCLDNIEIKEMLKTTLQLDENGTNINLLLLTFSKYIQNCTNIDDDEKLMIINDINDLLKHWHEYAKKTDNKSLQQFRNFMALGKTHPLTQKNGITFSTVHTMKGQEYDIVFLIGMDDGTFPDYRAIRNRGLEMEQEKNNLYVALTRAKRFLYVTWPENRLMPWGDINMRRVSRLLEVFQ